MPYFGNITISTWIIIVLVCIDFFLELPNFIR